MAKSSYRIKMSPSMKPFVSRVSRHGAIQRAFAASSWVQSLSSCVGNATRGKKGQLSGGQIKDIVRDCAKSAGAKGSSIPGFPGSDGKWKERGGARFPFTGTVSRTPG